MARLRIRDFDTALRFTGAGSHVIVTNPSVLDFTTNFTLSAWFKPATVSGTGASEKYIIAKALPADGTYKYAVFIGLNNRLGFAIYNGTTNPRVDDTTSIQIGSWSHVVATYDGANIKLYRNGVFIAQTATTISLPTGTSNFEIGRRAGASDRNMSGMIDECLTWNRALSATEVSDLYYNGLDRGSTLASGLVGEWLFNEGSGSTAYDTSGNGNNGTITGATYTTDVPMINRSVSPTTGSIKLRRRRADGEMLVNGAPSYTPSGTVATSTNGRWIDGTSAGSTTDDSFGWAFMSEYTGSARMINEMFELTASGTPPSNNHRVDINHVKASDSGGRSNMLAYCIPLEANTTYKATFDLKLENISSTNSRGFRVLASTYNADATASTGYGSTYLNGSRDWAPETFYFSTGTQRGWLRFSMEIRGETGTAYIKELSVKKAAPNLRPKFNGNLIFNGDFKYVPPFTAATTTTARWVDGTSGGSTTNGTFNVGITLPASSASVQFDTSVTFNGLPSIKISTLNATGRGQANVGALSTGSSLSLAALGGAAKIRPSTEYKLSYRVKTNNAATNSVFIGRHLHNGIGTRTSSTDSTTKFSGTNDWTYVEELFTSGASDCYAIFPLLNNVAGNISDAWFADIQLKPTTPPTRQIA